MSEASNQHIYSDLVVEEVKPKLKRPPMFKVMLLNDDYTPMEFVIEVLRSFFQMPQEQATEVMLQVHNQGKGICGVYSRDIAETKVQQVNIFSRNNDYPLLCIMETN